jgi:hypothetical protein
LGDEADTMLEEPMPWVRTRLRRENVMQREFHASVWQEDDWYIAQCIEVDVASQGETEGEALGNLAEALRLHFTPPCATTSPRLRSVPVEIGAA